MLTEFCTKCNVEKVNSLAIKFEPKKKVRFLYFCIVLIFTTTF